MLQIVPKTVTQQVRNAHRTPRPFDCALKYLLRRARSVSIIFRTQLRRDVGNLCAYISFGYCHILLFRSMSSSLLLVATFLPILGGCCCAMPVCRFDRRLLVSPSRFVFVTGARLRTRWRQAATLFTKYLFPLPPHLTSRVSCVPETVERIRQTGANCQGCAG